MMNSKSSNDFRWSVRLTGNTCKWIGLGIASNKLVQNKLSEIINYEDTNAIVYYPQGGYIQGNNLYQTYKSRNATSGDEIHFRFQPKLKKFFISFVSQLFWHFSFLNLEFQKDEEQAVDIKEGIDYFPVMEGGIGDSATLFKPQEG